MRKSVFYDHFTIFTKYSWDLTYYDKNYYSSEIRIYKQT